MISQQQLNSTELKSLITPLFSSMTDFSQGSVLKELESLLSEDCTIHMCFPFNDLKGPSDYYNRCYKNFLYAMPDLERRNLIVLAGQTPKGGNWVSTMGNYLGTFKKPFLDILPTGHIAHIRFHEFYRFENNKVVEIQTIWDLPELMISSNSWPLAPQLGTYMYTPSPLTGDGLYISGDGQKSEKRVKEMLTDLCRHPDNPDPNVMNLDEHWHPHFNWYGPAGIGSCKGIDGFRNWHQIPFLKAMPDRKVDQNSDRLSSWSADTHWISEGNYVSETGWPNMVMNLKYDGWMGIAPVDKNITLRSLDFWRIGEDGRIRENWVLVDLLDMYHQIGVDVFSRIKEFNKAKSFSFSEVEGNKK